MMWLLRCAQKITAVQALPDLNQLNTNDNADAEITHIPFVKLVDSIRYNGFDPEEHFIQFLNPRRKSCRSSLDRQAVEALGEYGGKICQARVGTGSDQLVKV
jgi:hypothetical protein